MARETVRRIAALRSRDASGAEEYEGRHTRIEPALCRILVGRLAMAWSSFRSAARVGLVAGAISVAATGCPPPGDVTRPPVVPTVSPNAPRVPPPEKNGRLPRTATPLRYELAVVVDPKKDRFTGDVAIDIDVPQAAGGIVMHGKQLTVIRAEALVSGTPRRAQTSFRKSSANDEEDELVLTFSEPIPAGKSQLRIAYSAPISSQLNGLYRVVENEVPYLVTQFEALDARRFMPCFDEPSFKAPLALKVTVPKGQLAFSNGAETARADVEDGTVFTFEETPPLPTYLYALAVGPYEVRDDKGAPPSGMPGKNSVPLRVIATKGKSKDAAPMLTAADASLKYLTSYFDRAYPYSKLDLMVVPEFAYGAMENAGLITFRDELGLVPESASVEVWRQMALTVAHEIAHHWFGNLVTMEWWDDVWLNEGFATWMELKVIDAWKPESESKLHGLSYRQFVMEEDSLGSARAVRQPVLTDGDVIEAFDGITYIKGAAVIGMLETWLGPDTFRDGVRAYLRAHEHKNATHGDLFASLGRVSGKDVAQVASTFLDQSGVPLVRAALSCDAGAAPKVTLTQAPYTPVGRTPSSQTWKIPVCINHEGADPKKPSCALLEGSSVEMPLPTDGAGQARCPKWIHPNAGEAGYYRYALAPADWDKLVGAADALDVRERLGLLGAARSLVQSGDLGADKMVDLIAALKKARHPLLVHEMVVGLDWLSRTVVDPAARPKLDAFAVQVLNPIARDLGWTPRPKDTSAEKDLRKTLFGALGVMARDPAARKMADKMGPRYLADPKSEDPNMGPIALGIWAMSADEARWNELVKRLATADSPEHRHAILEALSAVESPALLQKSLDLALTDKVKVQDTMVIVIPALHRAATAPVAWAWLKDNVAALKTKLPPLIFGGIGGVVAGACDAKMKDEMTAFLQGVLKGVEGSDRAFRQGQLAAQLCIDVRGRERERLTKRLTKR